jgi:DNA-binding PadR family transcriptional regulator
MLDLESEIINQMNQRVINGFLDVLILLELRKEPASDKGLIIRVLSKFHVKVEAQSVNSILASLEKDGLIKSEPTQNSRIYSLTERGKETVSTILNLRSKILGLVLNILTG